jgi:threonylcarbamoyladenosine tRNA methylthiotransferase MtaB
MGRDYTPAFIAGLVGELIAKVADISIGFDVIAGFPGESDADHAATCRLIDSLPIAYLHVFSYSSRPGTVAAAMPGHLHSTVVKQRAEELRRLGERKRLVFAERFVGRDLQVLVQGDGSSGIARNYLNVKLEGDGTIAGDEVAVRIIGVNPDGSCRGLYPHDSRTQGAAI